MIIRSVRTGTTILGVAVAAWIAMLVVLGVVQVHGQATTVPSTGITINDSRCWDDSDSDNVNDKHQTCVPVPVLRVTFPTYKAGQPPPTVEYQQSIHDLQLQLLSARDQITQLQKSLLSVQQAEIDAAYVAAAPTGYRWDSTKHSYVPVK